jgi:hypothetical protein
VNTDPQFPKSRVCSQDTIQWARSRNTVITKVAERRSDKGSSSLSNLYRAKRVSRERPQCRPRGRGKGLDVEIAAKCRTLAV